jgi:long-chain fatty acid transport protein
MSIALRTAIASIVLAPLAPATAGASGFALLEQSASRIGTAFAGTAAEADDATTLFFNPAGMSSLTEAQAIALASGIEITSQLHSSGSVPAFGQPLGGSGGDAGDLNVVPGAYLVVPLAARLTAGIGVNAPFGLALEYDAGWVGRFQALRSEIETLNVNPALSYRLNEHVAIGAGISYQRIQAELTNAVNYSAVVAQGIGQLVASGQLPPSQAPALIAANAGLEGDARVRGDDTAWGFNFGALFDVTDATRIGISYRSAIDYEVGGTIRFAPPGTVPNPLGASIVAAASAQGAPLASGPVSVQLKLPDSATVSLHQQFTPHFALLADVAWTGWSTVQELRIVRDSGATVSVTPERWRDVFRYALGATYELSDALTLRAGVAYDNTPVPDATRTPRLPDPDRTWATLGMRWKPAPALAIEAGYAHLFSEDVPLDQSAGNPAASGIVRGEQVSDIDILSVQLTYGF